MPDLNIPNLNRLIAHLEAQPPERINMGECEPAPMASGLTCGCVYVHAAEVGIVGLAKDLGLHALAELRLTQPEGWCGEREVARRYPAHRVIATLKRLRDRFLATGEIVVDWGPEPTAGEPWGAPQAIELIPLALPAEITRLLSVAPATETSGA